jgi:RNA polymerase sigma factor (sigma-70 family)
VCPAMNLIDKWFTAEILPHAASLVRYLHRIWRDEAEVYDMRQEIFIRIYENAKTSSRDLPTQAKAKNLVFVTARHLISDRIRRRRIISIDYTQDLDSLNVLIDELSPERRLSARQELRRLSEALDRLPDPCRTAIWLKRVEGLTQREIADRLRISEGSLEGYLTRGVRALTKAVFGSRGESELQEDVKGMEHGN